MKEKPIRIQRKRVKGFNLQAESIARNGLPCVYVGRQNDGSFNVGEYGNPFRIGSYYKVGNGGNMTFRWLSCLIADHADESFTFVKDRETSLAMYKTMIERYPPSEMKLAFLRGKNLACWCSEESECHADILLEMANK